MLQVHPAPNHVRPSDGGAMTLTFGPPPLLRRPDIIRGSGNVGPPVPPADVVYPLPEPSRGPMRLVQTPHQIDVPVQGLEGPAERPRRVMLLEAGGRLASHSAAAGAKQRRQCQAAFGVPYIGGRAEQPVSRC
jgi:hypothetical protein